MTATGRHFVHRHQSRAAHQPACCDLRPQARKPFHSRRSAHLHLVTRRNPTYLAQRARYIQKKLHSLFFEFTSTLPTLTQADSPLSGAHTILNTAHLPSRSTVIRRHHSSPSRLHLTSVLTSADPIRALPLSISTHSTASKLYSALNIGAEVLKHQE